MTSSRLDRLFVLLESGSSAVTRSAAAKQLGEVQRLHPHELHTLLGRVTTYIRSPNWETRIAAGEAVQAIISNLPQWLPQGTDIKKEEDGESSFSQIGRLKFDIFDINSFLANSSQLMGSEGKEYDFDEEQAVSGDNKERLAKQRQLLNARLGLDVASKLGMDVSDIYTNDDLVVVPSDIQIQSINKNDDTIIPKKPINLLCTNQLMSGSLSSREINRAKRKARQAIGKQKSREPSCDDNTTNTTSTTTTTASAEEPDKKKIKLEDNKNNVKEENIVLGDGVPDGTGSWVDAIDWPLECFADQLCHDLFSANWVIRHGAATAFREVLRIHGKGGGRSADIPRDLMETNHQSWLEDIAIRLLCVLALDRFGDFVSDAVVAPVRETCAQCLGTVLRLMNDNGIKGVLNVLLQLLEQKEWEARHGGLLGLKYLLAVKMNIVHTLLPAAFPKILEGLSDLVDDVGAVAASALIPVSADLVRLLPDQIPLVISKLWDLLAEQDELAAACNSFMGLLAAILSLPDVQKLLPPQPLSEVVPRLWPFLSHNASSVRRATLQTLTTLTSKSSDGSFLQWSPVLLQDALRHVFQRVLVEHLEDVQRAAEKVWENLVRNSGLAELLHAACPFVSTWICLTMQPAKVPFDASLFIHARSSRERKTKPGTVDNNLYDSHQPVVAQKWFMGGSETIPLATREANVVRARCMAARMLGLLSCFIVKPAPGIEYTSDIESPIDCYVKVLLVYLQSKSAVQRMMTGLIIAEWARLDSDSETKCPDALKNRLHECLSECVYFDEIAVSFTKLLQETRDFLAMMKHYKIPINYEQYGNVLTLDQIQQLSGIQTQQILAKIKLKPKVAESLEERRKNIQGSVSQTSSDQFMLSVSTLAALSGAAIMFHTLPEKLNPVVKPLMESVKRENNEMLQELTAKYLSRLMEQCEQRQPCPNTKIISNLSTFLRCDPEFTPKIYHNNSPEGSSDSGVESISGENSRTTTPTAPWTQVGNYNGIVTLNIQQRSAERAAFRRSNSTGRGPGRPSISDIALEELFNAEDENQKGNRVQRRGSTLALVQVTQYFGEHLPTKLPRLWELMIGQLVETINPQTFEPLTWLNKDSAAEELVWILQVLEVAVPHMHSSLLPEMFTSALPRLTILLSHPYCAVRHMAARCLAVLAKIDSVPVMEKVVHEVLPLLGATDSNTNRQGAAECIACIVDTLQFNIVPYVVLLVVPLLGRMSDQNQLVRLMATHSFATLVQLMPLDGGVPEPPALVTSSLKGQRDRERQFLKQLLSPSTIPDYVVPVPIQAELRSYQQSGVNWLAFLNKYKLHGILCDDMGLGKTLQSICILAGDHYVREQQYKATKTPDCVPLPSLVICPPTLTGHWVYEVEKFLSHKYLKPLQYIGTPGERERLRQKFKRHNLIVASYDIVRKDISFFSLIKWNYCILDEGHIIKNGKTRTSIAIKNLVANHRLILSGTPIQNNVLELWSLFDFLMPGFLGTEKQFTARYSRPILASRDPKSSPKEQEAGALAMEALHRQVLPFLLRRMKEDVLDDLPPKITQDYYCDLSPMQVQLYDDFSKSQAHQSLQESLSSGATASSMQGNSHIFQALRYLQNVCNHPKLVLTPQHPRYTAICGQLQQSESKLDDIVHSAKLPALKQLLLDCGIGMPEMQPTDLVINQHRALIFCQLKAMLDIIENDLFRKHMPAVTYLRLDGTVPPAQRHAIVTRFNNDPSIDVLLLTTQVGGLGLNLTGADTVIFVEHDWNPMKDLQAMDRAHRIGQKKVVNVYRLITLGTLEEKIMGLQKFKVQTANTVISGENSKLETMGTGQLLDLFSHKPTTSAAGNTAATNSVTGSVKTMLENLPDLWDDKQYEDEYDLSQFIDKLRN